MKIIETLSENLSMSFSGRLNILSKDTKQFFASVLQREGVIVNAFYGKLSGKKALAAILIESKTNKNIVVVSEPELIETKEIQFEMNEYEFFKFKNDYYEKFESLNKLKPSPELNLSLNGLNLDVYTPLSTDEFSVMKAICDNSKVSEIYKNCSMLDFDVTKSLISLRKKGIILVHR